jgi:hypothetical protein
MRRYSRETPFRCAVPEREHTATKTRLAGGLSEEIAPLRVTVVRDRRRVGHRLAGRVRLRFTPMDTGSPARREPRKSDQAEGGDDDQEQND